MDPKEDGSSRSLQTSRGVFLGVWLVFGDVNDCPTLQRRKNPAGKHTYIVWGDPEQILQVKSCEKKTNQNDDKHVMAKVTTCFQPKM